jgi:ABC-type dipeptide/oligopeptide/nickel transport system ATPase component
MDDGEIIEVGKPPEIFVNPKHPRTREFMSKVLHVGEREMMDTRRNGNHPMEALKKQTYGALTT